MNREILFRGKDKQGNWHKGFLTTDAYGNHFIESVKETTLYSTKVISKTIGQFTGLFDSKGKQIFEGDYLSFYTKRSRGFQRDGLKVITKPVEFGLFWAKDDCLYKYIGFNIDEDSIHYKLENECVIEGNIYDNDKD